MTKEYIIECTPDGTIIGPIERVYAHTPEVRPHKTHYSTWVMVYNPPLKKYGLQLKRPKKHDRNQFPMWDMGVAGHNCYQNNKPMSFEETLVKETNEEIGLTVIPHTSLDSFKEAAKTLDGTIGYIYKQFLYHNTRNSEWVGLGIILTTETTVDFKDHEVLDFKWVTPTELHSELMKKEKYHAVLPLVLEQVEQFRKKQLQNI